MSDNEELYREGNYWLESDNMTAVDLVRPRLVPGTPKKCEWAGCEEITISGCVHPMRKRVRN